MDGEPIVLVDAGLIDDESVWLWGVNAYGRIVWAVIPWWNSTPEGIATALHDAYLAQVDDERDRAGALASYQAESLEPYALADVGTGE